MYRWFCRFLPPRAAQIAAVVWYLGVFLLMYVLAYRDDAGFLYMNL